MLEVVESLVIVSVEGDGGGCFVSSCGCGGWFIMFLSKNAKSVYHSISVLFRDVT